MHVREGEGGGKGEYGRIWGEVEGNADYGRIVQPSQKHVAQCVKVVEWGLGTRGLRMEYVLRISTYSLSHNTYEVIG